MSKAKKNSFSGRGVERKKRGGGGRKGGPVAEGEGAQNLPLHPGTLLPPEIAQLSPSRTLLILKGYMEHLTRLAEAGNDEAIQYLHDSIVNGTARLHGIIERNPILASKVRTPGQPWPMLTTDLKVSTRGHLTVPKDHLLRRIGVLRKGQTFHDDFPGTKAAMILYGIVERYRRLPSTIDDANLTLAFSKLAPLSPANFIQWWKLANKWIVKWWGEEFQDDHDFKGWKDANYEGFDPASKRSKKRSDIKKGIRQAFRSLANNLALDHLG